MFNLDIPSIAYTDPWKIPLIERLSALNYDQPSVVYYYDFPDNSTFRYRVYNMIQALKSINVSATFLSYKDQNYLEDLVDCADILVVCRARYTHKLNRAIVKAKNKGKTVFFDIDDLVFVPSLTHFILDTLDQDLENPKVWDFWFGYIGRQFATMELCERVITTNKYLANMIQKYLRKPVMVIPNFLNNEQLNISDQIFKQKVQRGFSRNKKITLGYFSGTPSHNKDFRLISDALAELLGKNSQIDLRVVGFMELRQPMDLFRSRIQFIKLQDFINLQRLIGEVEVNLVPLQNNIFTNCKSELKFFEAGVVGTITVASPVYTYAKAIRDGQNGFLAQDHEWLEKIELAISQLPDNYSIIAERAHQDSIEQFAWYNQVQTIYKTLFDDVS